MDYIGEITGSQINNSGLELQIFIPWATPKDEKTTDAEAEGINANILRIHPGMVVLSQVIDSTELENIEKQKEDDIKVGLDREGYD